MKNIKKIKSNILQISIVIYLIFGCGKGDQQPSLINIENETPTLKREQEAIKKLQTKLQDELDTNNIDYKTIGYNNIPNKKQELEQAITKIKKLKIKGEQLNDFVKKRPKLKSELNEKYYVDNKINLEKIDEIEKIKNKRKADEDKIIKNDKKIKIKDIKNLTSTELKNYDNKTKKQNKTKKDKLEAIKQFMKENNIASKLFGSKQKQEIDKYHKLIETLNKIKNSKIDVYDTEGNLIKNNIEANFDLTKLKLLTEQYEKSIEITKAENIGYKYIFKKNNLKDQKTINKLLYKKELQVIQKLNKRAKLLESINESNKDKYLDYFRLMYLSDSNTINEKEIDKKIQEIKIYIEGSKLSNSYFIDLKNENNVKKLNQVDGENLIKQLYTTDQIQNKETEEQKLNEVKKIVNDIVLINNQLNAISEYKQFQQIKGIYVQINNETIKMLRSVPEIIKAFKLYQNINIKNISTELSTIKNKLNNITENIKINKQLYEKEVYKKDMQEIFDSKANEPDSNELDQYSTIQQLISDKKNNKANKLLERQEILNKFPKQELIRIQKEYKSLKNAQIINVSNNIEALKQLKTISKNVATYIDKLKNNSTKNNNHQKYNLNTYFSLAETKKTGIYFEISLRAQEHIAKNIKQESITYYNAEKDETIFNTYDQKQFNKDENIGLKFQSIIALIKKVVKDSKVKQIFQNTKLEYKNKKQFVAKYINLCNKETGNGIAQILGHALVKNRTSPHITKTIKYLNRVEGLDLNSKSANTNKESFVDILNKDTKEGKWEIKFEENNPTLIESIEYKEKKRK